MKHFIGQFVKFGIVGVIAFVINWAIMNGLELVHVSAVIASTTGFIISLIYNYIASMRHVFVHRDDMPRWMEMVVFIVSSVIGLLINDVIIWFFTSVMISPSTIHTAHATYMLYSNIGMLVATVIVAVWNFAVRKILLDKPAPGKEDENTLAHRIGVWSMAHTPKGWK